MFRKTPESISPRQFKKAEKTYIPDLSPADWGRRSDPAYFVAGTDFSSREMIRRQNIAYLLRKLQAQGGKIIGYHGTTTPNALEIKQNGFKDFFSVEEEITPGVSLADEVAAFNSVRFALKCSRSNGLTDPGLVLKVRATDPLPDFRKGRLEWRVPAANCEILEVLHPAAIPGSSHALSVIPEQFIPVEDRSVR